MLQFPTGELINTIGLDAGLAAVQTIVNGGPETSQTASANLTSSEVRITISDEVLTGALILISVPDCTNPPTTSPTNNFSFSSFTSSDQLIDTLSSDNGPNIVMTTPNSFSSIALNKTSFMNSASVNLTFQISHQQIISENSVLRITIPNGFVFPSNGVTGLSAIN